MTALYRPVLTPVRIHLFMGVHWVHRIGSSLELVDQCQRPLLLFTLPNTIIVSDMDGVTDLVVACIGHGGSDGVGDDLSPSSELRVDSSSVIVAPTLHIAPPGW